MADFSRRAVNPGIIYASISGFGAGGGKDLPGYDLMIPASYSSTPASYPLPPPAPDEHGGQIRAWLAGPAGPLPPVSPPPAPAGPRRRRMSR